MGKILVTGATGFTGKALCRRLAHDAEQVVAFVRQNSDIAPLEELGIECCRVNITNRQEVMTHFDNIDRVYHIAAAYRTEHSDKNEFRLVNVEATRNLLEAGKRFGVKRFIHCSTVGVQGEIEAPPATEEYRTKPGDHYQHSKLDGELLALKYFQEGLPGVVFRPVGIYGPGDTRFLKLFKAINAKKFIMIGSGDVLYHMTYIDDLVEGILLCGNIKDIEGEVFTIAGERHTTLRELVNLIADVLGISRPKLRIPFYPVFLASILCDQICKAINISPPLYPRRVEFFSLDRAFSIEKAKQLLGYKPQVSLREGIAQTASWYKEQGIL